MDFYVSHGRAGVQPYGRPHAAMDGRRRRGHAAPPSRMHGADLEVSAAQDKVYLLPLTLLQVLQRAVNLIKLPVAAALHGDLRRSATMSVCPNC